VACSRDAAKRVEKRTFGYRSPAERIDAMVLSHAHIRDPQPPNGAAAVIIGINLQPVESPLPGDRVTL